MFSYLLTIIVILSLAIVKPMPHIEEGGGALNDDDIYMLVCLSISVSVAIIDA